MTTRGGIKATKLAGDILNNTNDKKGHHDTFRSWWKTNVGEDLTFPDTSNTRFQSHCEAAAVLLQHLPHFVEFLDFIKEKKANNRFSNMEQNCKGYALFDFVFYYFSLFFLIFLYFFYYFIALLSFLFNFSLIFPTIDSIFSRLCHPFMYYFSIYLPLFIDFFTYITASLHHYYI